MPGIEFCTRIRTMTLLVRNLSLGLDEPEESLRARAARRLRIPDGDIHQFAIVRRAIDARKKDRIALVYNVEVGIAGGERAEQRLLHRLHRQDVAPISLATAPPLEPGTEPLAERPVVVGFGPAGMFAALWLARRGYRPIVLERGQGVKTRHRDVMHRFYRQHDFDAESNLLFGEGGAGAYSDGKLYTRVNDPHMHEILEAFVDHGGDRDILIDARPHLGSDRIPTLCKRIRESIIAGGGEVRFGARLDDVEIRDGRLARILVVTGPTRRGGTDQQETNAQHAYEWIACGPVLLGVGHSARDTIRMLAQRGVAIAAKPFQIGVRVEHPQSMVDRWQYGASCGHGRLPPSEYHLVSKGTAAELGDVYSFCMCPGGIILPTNESPGLIATNGASGVSRSLPFANSGLVLTVPTSLIHDDPLAGLAWCEKWERLAYVTTGESYRVPAQRAADMVAGRLSDGKLETSYPLGGAWTDMHDILPDFAVDAIRRALLDLDRRLPGFAGVEGLVTGPETRASAPVRIVRDAITRESVSAAGLYPVGEGAGYAGGIMSAAADGIRTAETIIRRYAPVS